MLEGPGPSSACPCPRATVGYVPPTRAWLVTQPGWRALPEPLGWAPAGGLICKLFLGASTGTKIEKSMTAASGPRQPRVRHSELCSPGRRHC